MVYCLDTPSGSGWNANNFVEKLVPLPDLEERIQAIEKLQGINPFNHASGEKEERLPLVALGSTRARATKYSEEELGEEMLKLLESKEERAKNDSMNEGSDEDSLDLDFSEDELGDITVNHSKTHVEDSNSPAGRRHEEHSYFEERQSFGQPNGIGNRAVTPVV